MLDGRIPSSSFAEAQSNMTINYFMWNDYLKEVNSQMGTRYYMTVYMRDMDPSWKSDVC